MAEYLSAHVHLGKTTSAWIRPFCPTGRNTSPSGNRRKRSNYPTSPRSGRTRCQPFRKVLPRRLGGTTQESIRPSILRKVSPFGPVPQLLPPCGGKSELDAGSPGIAGPRHAGGDPSDRTATLWEEAVAIHRRTSPYVGPSRSSS